MIYRVVIPGWTTRRSEMAAMKNYRVLIPVTIFPFPGEQDPREVTPVEELQERRLILEVKAYSSEDAAQAVILAIQGMANESFEDRATNVIKAILRKWTY